MKNYRIEGCASKEKGLDCTCAYCTYLTKEGDKYFDDSVRHEFRDWRVAKLMELEDRIKALESAKV